MKKTIITVITMSFISSIAFSQDEMAIIKEFDLVDSWEQVEWTNLDHQDVAKGVERVDVSSVLQKNLIMNAPFGPVQGKGVVLTARPSDGKEDYGILAHYVVNLPKERYIQFQGGGEIVHGALHGPAVVLMIETQTADTDSWVAEGAFPVRGFDTSREEHPGSFYFKEDLSEWAGKRVRLSLRVQAHASYAKVGNNEVWTPSHVKVHLFNAELISSTFKVEFGESEKILDLSSAKTRYPRESTTHVEDVTGGVSTILTRYIKGGGESESGYLENPSDLSISCVTAESGTYYPARTLYYFSARGSNGHTIHDGVHDEYAQEWEYGASTRVIDFATNSDINPAPYTTSSSEFIDNLLYLNDGSGEASYSLTPSGDADRDFDDHFTGISSVLSRPIPNVGDTLHAFFYTEDHFRDDTNHNGKNVNNVLQIYGSIGYATSYYQHPGYGRTYFKQKNNDYSYGNVVNYEFAEDDIYYTPFRAQYGVGQPSVIEIGDYFYMIYITFACRRGDNWGTLTKYLYDSGSINISTTCDLINNDNCGYYPNPILTCARALKTDVLSSNYSNSSNPWKKFKEVNPNQWDDPDNWVEDGGYGGKCSGLWNVDKYDDGNVKVRTDLWTVGKNWRANPKVSWNEEIEQYLIVCSGGSTEVTNGFYIHTGSNIVDMGTSMLMLAEDDIMYPSLVNGSYNTDVLTKYNNFLYYSIKENGYYSLYRRRCIIRNI